MLHFLEGLPRNPTGKLLRNELRETLYFSIVQRKVLTPNDFPHLSTLEKELLAFGRRYEQIATPFEWKFTRTSLNRLAQRFDRPAAQAARANTSANFRARALRPRRRRCRHETGVPRRVRLRRRP